eukprot:EG_transcript_43339
MLKTRSVLRLGARRPPPTLWCASRRGRGFTAPAGIGEDATSPEPEAEGPRREAKQPAAAVEVTARFERLRREMEQMSITLREKQQADFKEVKASLKVLEKHMGEMESWTPPAVVAFYCLFWYTMLLLLILLVYKIFFEI